MANYFVKQLKGSDLGWWTEAENLGKARGKQRAVNLNREVYDDMFPGVISTDFQIDISYRDGDTWAIVTQQRRVKEEQKNMRLAGPKIPGQYYGALEPDDYMVIKMDGAHLTFAVVMMAERPDLHQAVAQLMNGEKMIQHTGAQKDALLEIVRAHDAELFGLAAEEQQWEDALDNKSDTEFEAWVNQLSVKASVKERLTKVRQASRGVTTGLKQQYNYCCQICGHSTTQLYGVPVVEAHHIEPFIRSQNHQPSNILILCPNHHRVWHAAGGRLDLTHLQVVYGNGLTEAIKLHHAGHLVPGNARN